MARAQAFLNSFWAHLSVRDRQRRTERVAHPRARRRVSEAATGLQPRPARRPVQTVRRYDRPRIRMGTAVPASRQLAASHRPTLAAARRRAALRPRRDRRLGARRRAADYRRWWDHAARLHIEADGSWRHQLDENNHPASSVWTGMPDLYHAFQAALVRPCHCGPWSRPPFPCLASCVQCWYLAGCVPLFVARTILGPLLCSYLASASGGIASPVAAANDVGC